MLEVQGIEFFLQMVHLQFRGLKLQANLIGLLFRFSNSGLNTLNILVSKAAVLKPFSMVAHCMFSNSSRLFGRNCGRGAADISIVSTPKGKSYILSGCRVGFYRQAEYIRN